MKPATLVPAAALLLAACGPIVQVGGNSPRPDMLYTLTATGATAVPPRADLDLARAVSVDLPAVPGALQTVRIPVTVTDTAIQYVQVAQWAEQPNRLFQRLLADTLVASGTSVVDVRSMGTAGGRRLSGQLLAFGVDVRGAPVVRVRYDATLAGGGAVRQRRFEREAPLVAVSGPEVAAALNSAANAVAADVALWVGQG